ncbi:MAG: hypothetical protein Q7J80_00585, partial [Anaerolineales bacterium]|nr:hypothetical protein [Anaerolineales bacterium]
MKICVLADEVFGPYSPADILREYEWKMYLVRQPSLEFLRDIAQRESYDVYLNLTDGMPDELDRPGLDVVQALESLGLPFTGADSEFYAPTRDEMQAVAAKHAVGFSRGVQVDFGMNVGKEVVRAGLRYPLIVKHHNSYGSVGMTRDSRVENSDQLQVQFDAVCGSFGSARVEEFIEGREFTCLVVDNPDNFEDPFVYDPLQVIFPPGESFRHFALKFDAD